MDKINEEIFQSIYKEVTSRSIKTETDIYRWPGIEEIDKDDEDRHRGQVILNSFPLPIGVELRRLFSISCQSRDKNRLIQVLTVIERSLQFTCYTLVSQLWHEIKVNKMAIPVSFGRILKQKIYLRHIQNYIWITQSVANVLAGRSVELFMPELKEFLNEESVCKLKYPYPEKSTDDRYLIKGDSESIERQCYEIEEILVHLLRQIAFLVNYKLVSVQKINVVKPRYLPPKYHHVLKLLVCTDSDFNTFNMEWDECADSHSVMLIKSHLDLTKNLNLSPFIIDTASFLADDHLINGINKDIFIYDGPKESHLNYKGCRVSDKCDMSIMPGYPLLTAQFTDLLDSISS